MHGQRARFSEIQKEWKDSADGIDGIPPFDRSAPIGSCYEGAGAICSRLNAFIINFLSGPCVVLFSQIGLVFTMMICTAEFPLANLPKMYFPDFPTLLKEQNAALALIMTSGLSILVINGAYFANQIMKFLRYLFKLPGLFEKKMKKVTKFDFKGFTGLDIGLSYVGCNGGKNMFKCITYEDKSKLCPNQGLFVFFALPLTLAILYAWKFTCKLVYEVYPPKKDHGYAVCTVLDVDYAEFGAGFFLFFFLAFFTCCDIGGSLNWDKANVQEAVCKQFALIRWVLWLFRDIPLNLYRLFCAPEEQRRELFDLMKSEVWGTIRQICPVDTLKDLWNTYCYGTTSIPGAACGGMAMGCCAVATFTLTSALGLLGWAHSFLCCFGCAYSALMAGLGSAVASMAKCDAFIVLPGTCCDRCMEATCDYCARKPEASSEEYTAMVPGTNQAEPHADKDWLEFDSKRDNSAW